MSQWVSYTSAARICGVVFLMLGFVLLLVPQIVFTLFDLNGGTSAMVIARRAGVLFVGLVYLVLSTATHPANPTRTCVTDAVGLLLIGLAALGALEWMRGSVGPGIWLAVATEVSLASLLWMARRAPQAMEQDH